MFDEWIEPFRVFLRIGGPISKGTFIAFATFEPTIIHHEQFHAQFRRKFRVGRLRVNIHIEEGRFPTIEQHLMQVIAMWQNFATDQVVHRSARIRERQARAEIVEAERRHRPMPS